MAMGDAPWSLPIQCTNAQIDDYLNDRASKGCTAILFELIEKSYSLQVPAYLNVDGVAPFTSITGNPTPSSTNWVLNDAYWRRIDYIVNGCARRGMACFVTPAYTGYGNGSDGWLRVYMNSSDAALQAYGEALARRYTQGNLVWVLGGDDANDAQAAGDYGSSTTPQRTKQWQIALGIQRVNPNAIITGHTARNGTGGVSGEAYRAWTSGYAGFNLNNIYGHDNTDDAAGLARTAYGRSGPMPFFLIEAGYENLDGSNDGGVIPAVQTVLSGGLAGFIGGHDALWHMGSYEPRTGAAAVLSSYLANSWLGYKYLANLLRAYAWHRLRPQRDTAPTLPQPLVTSGLGTGSASICPALADDRSFAMIWVPNRTITVNMAALGPTSVRARWYNLRDGTYTSIGTGLSNSGSRSFTSPGNRVLVLDAG